tara:strand:- start:13687 stop:14169 length:483 start_codon:yes stop_codon:yes gene_type:complete
MGQLSSLKIHRETVDYGDQQFTVRAITTSDLLTVVAERGAELSMTFAKVYEEAQKRDGPVTSATIRKLIMDAAGEFPDIAACIIASAADDYTPEGILNAKQLPFPVQTDAIEKIFHATFRSEAEVKKLMESLTRMVVATSGALVGMDLNLPTGIGESADK